MKLAYRFVFYFGGFSIGLLFLMFFLSGKKTSCAYGPDARVLKNIQIKSIKYSESVQNQLNNNVIDTLTLNSIFKGADINFSKSDEICPVKPTVWLEIFMNWMLKIVNESQPSKI